MMNTFSLLLPTRHCDYPFIHPRHVAVQYLLNGFLYILSRELKAT